jgi:transposase-like protein
MVAKRCPRCGSRQTKKKGFVRSCLHTSRGVIPKKLQRYFCLQCRKSFTYQVANKRHRYSQGLIRSAVKRYLEDSTALRPVARSFGISPRSLLNWVVRYGNNAKSPIEVAAELKPKWSGLLGVDGKELRIKGQELTALIAQDVMTFDPVFFCLADSENVQESEYFFLIIKDVLRYPTRGIVSDLGRGKAFVARIAKVFPGVPHQACVIHFYRYVQRTIPAGKKSPWYRENRFLRRTIYDLLFTQQLAEAEELLHSLQNNRHLFRAAYHQTIIRSLERHFHLLSAHFHHPVLVRDNNVTENLIRQLNRKIKQSDGFKIRDNADSFLKLWFIYYRFNPFVNSSVKHRNGKTPLELAGVNIKNRDWLSFSQKNRPS